MKILKILLDCLVFALLSFGFLYTFYILISTGKWLGFIFLIILIIIYGISIIVNSFPKCPRCKKRSRPTGIYETDYSEWYCKNCNTAFWINDK